MPANPVAYYPKQGGGGNSGALTLIETITTAGGEGSVVFSDIPQTFTHLKLVASATGQSGTVGNLIIEFNGDSSFSYSLAYTSNTQAGTVTSVSAPTDNFLIVGCSGLVGNPGASEVTIPGYTAVNFHTAIGQGTAWQGSNFLVTNGGGLYGVAAAITSLIVAIQGQSFAAGSVISLYGMQ